jgi:hypothetical protein
VPLVLDLQIAHDRVGSSGDPTLNGHLKYPNNLDQSLNDGSSIVSKSHTHLSHSSTSRLLTSSLSLGVPVPRPVQCV